MKLFSSSTVITSIDWYYLIEGNKDIYLEHTVKEDKQTFVLKSAIKDVCPIVVDEHFWDLIKKQSLFDRNSYDWFKNTFKSLKEADSLKENNFLYLRMNDRCLFDLNMNVIPQVLTFDYISCPITTCKSKNIKNMLKILSKNEFILNKDKMKLKLVPYYDNTSGNEEMIVNEQNNSSLNEGDELKILIPKETYQEIYNIAMETHKRASPNVLKQILFKHERDFLGVRHLINEEFLYIF